MKKKMLAMTLAALMMLSAVALTGCSGDATTTTSTETATTTTTTTTTPSTESQASDVEIPSEITIIVPSDAGGAVDSPARVMARYMSELSDIEFTVTNMTGSSGLVGGAYVKDDVANDGSTILACPVGYYYLYAMGISEFSYADFENISFFADSYLAIVVRSDSGIETYDDYIAAIKEKGSDWKQGAVTGTIPVLATLEIQKTEGLDYTMVDLDYDNKATELMGGRIDSYIDSVNNVASYVDSGEFNMILIFSHDPVAGYEDYTLAGEVGYEDFDYILQSFGFWAPEGTPVEVQAAICEALQSAAADPDCIAEMVSIGCAPAANEVGEYAEICARIQESTNETCKVLLA